MAESLLNKFEYFVIHSTDSGTMDTEQVEAIKSSGKKTKGHAYILRDGTTVMVWPYTDGKVTATKAEQSNYFGSQAVGTMIHVELDTKSGTYPTEQQYIALAKSYIDASDANNLPYGTLIILTHKVVDWGIPNGHSDPTDIDLNFFYRMLNDAILARVKAPYCLPYGVSQERHDMKNRADYKESWPPNLSTKFTFDVIPKQQLKSALKAGGRK